jgi:hypothetical protein
MPRVKPRGSPQDHAAARYGPNNPLAVKVATRNIPLYRDPAV